MSAEDVRGELERLAERCEQATGPDRELEREIGTAVGRVTYDGIVIASGYIGTPSYTDRLDAAARLVPEGWDWSATSLGEDGACAQVWQHGWMDDTSIHSFKAPTPCLCLIVAALRAAAALARSGE